MSKRLMSKKSEKVRDLGVSIKLSLSISQALSEIEKTKTKLNGSPFNPI